MFFQEPTPDTSGYMIAGYAVAFIVLAIYVASLYIRNRNLKQDLTMLEEMEKPAVKIQASPIRKTKKQQAKPSTKTVKK